MAEPTNLVTPMAVVGAATVEGLIEALLELDHEVMVTALELFLGA